ncbi:MAG: aryl-sulfate sulfotransferase [Bacteroidota bacterium]
MKRIYILCLLALLFLWSACEEEPNIGNVGATISVNRNPSAVAPLTAMLSVTTQVDVSIHLRVIGKNGENSDVNNRFDEFGREFELPVLGLYADHENEVELTFFDGANQELGKEIVKISTNGLINDMPEVSVQTSNIGAMAPGFNLVNYFGFAENFNPQRALMFDAYGDIRWYLNYSGHPRLANLFYDNGMIRLQNGNLFFGDGSTGSVYEINMLGEIQNSWSLKGNGFHHMVLEKPNENFLVTVNDPNKFTVEDLIIELDRNSGNIVNRWDLTLSLDKDRRAWDTDLANTNVDWMHANGVAYSEIDDCIIVSGRTQGTVKLTASNEPVWIIAPHKGWETSGNGNDLKQYLLQPLDAMGQPILDSLVLNGEENHPDFEWAWYQHSPIILPNGNVMLFDNGDNRNYSANGFSGPFSYSRAVEYKIDEENMTIQQVWSYGKGRRNETYSRIVSKVLYYENEDNVLFTPGAVAFNGEQYGKVLEIDKQSGQVVFEAKVKAPIAPFNITFHNIYRYTMYP